MRRKEVKRRKEEREEEKIKEERREEKQEKEREREREKRRRERRREEEERREKEKRREEKRREENGDMVLCCVSEDSVSSVDVSAFLHLSPGFSLCGGCHGDTGPDTAAGSEISSYSSDVGYCFITG
ncbi:hypothetical protein Baya_15563 [Bagarius yarrelli]|uniref:Uncharacterized protein n=1 Tax=Bagarius yarrelli TaxID=175774 RepID=A0A556VC15_BAGYA|nr:hypothetical protein Baya_15563 [Bagarius yarrelli]